MLVLKRNMGQSLIITPLIDASPDMTVKDLFSNGPIVITVEDQSVQIGIEAPGELLIVRDELLEDT